MYHRRQSAGADNYPGSQISQNESQVYESHIKLISSAENQSLKKILTGINDVVQLPSTQIPKEVLQVSKSDIHLLDEHNKPSFELYKCEFHYFGVKIHKKKQPLLVLIRPENQEVKLRMFISTKFSRPNRFNCELQVQGKKILYRQSGEASFEENYLYVTVFSNESTSCIVNCKFGFQFTQTNRDIQRYYYQKQQNKQDHSDREEKEFSQRRKDIIIKNLSTTQYTRSAQYQKRNQLADELYFREQNAQKKKKISDLQIQVEKTQNYHEKQVKFLLNQNRKKIAAEQAQKEKFYEIWSTIIKSIAPITAVYKHMLKARNQFVRNMRRKFIMRMALKQFYSKQKKWGSNPKQRLLIEVYYSFVVRLQLHEKQINQRLGFVITDFLSKTGGYTKSVKKISKLLEITRKVAIKWKKFRKLKLDFINRIRYNIQLTLQIVYEGFQNQYDDEMIVQNLIRYRTSQLQLKRRNSSVNNAFQKRKPLNPAQTFFTDPQFQNVITRAYVKLHTQEWSARMTKFRQTIKEKNEQGDKRLKILAQLEFPILFTDIEWKILIIAARLEFKKRGFLH